MTEEKTQNHQIVLKGGQTYLSGSSFDAYRVESGIVLVYIVPVSNGQTLRRTCIYEAQEGEVIPGFRYLDSAGKEWAFCLAPLETARMEQIENGGTRRLKERFSKKAGIRNFEYEGYEGGLVDQYEFNLVKEDSFIHRSQKQRERDLAKTGQLIRDSFRKKNKSTYIRTENSLYDAAAAVCSQLHVKIIEFEKLKEFLGEAISIADIARLSRFAYREVTLRAGWYKEDGGPFLVFDRENNPKAVLQRKSGGYVLFDPKTGAQTPVTDKNVEQISPRACMFYRPLPERRIGAKEIFSFCLDCVRAKDVILLILMTAATAALGLLLPYMNQAVYDTFIPLGNITAIWQIGSVLAAFLVSNLLFSVIRNIVQFRITGRMAIEAQAAVFHRVFHLRESFFRNYEAADLANRLMKTGEIVNNLAGIFLNSSVALIFAIVYFLFMLRFSGALAAAGLVMTILYCVVYYFLSVAGMKYKRKGTPLSAEADSRLYQFINGISKIRIAGVEERALYEYFRPYVDFRNCEEKKNNRLNMGTVLHLVSGSVFSVILYILVIRGFGAGSFGGFIAFSTLFGSFSAYAMGIADQLTLIKQEQPDIDRLKPVFQEDPELDDAKELPGDLTGSIEINNVSFSYAEEEARVLDGISLNIRPGEYLGIVGPSGCGKSTLMKLLLGFEKPTSGKIYYDNKDMESIDKRELRKKMGVVLQDGKLIAGSIYENITITSPGTDMEEVLRVIREVGLEEDISAMPMGMYTMLSEDCGTISGGQQQRILIARAILGDPRIILFDEATSALDNISQNIICDNLKELKATRIVIAHRLSTVIHCDRIVVMDEGKIKEQGTYEELMEKQGIFYQLAGRQM